MPDPLRTALLRHHQDAASHLDWLFQLPEPPDPAHPLRAFRLAQRPDLAAPGDLLDALPLPDHRALYLEYQGPVHPRRGHVQRLADGLWLPLSDDPLLGPFELRWAHRPPQRWNAENGAFRCLTS